MKDNKLIKMAEVKRLVKSQKNRTICGVCCGLAEYLDLDPTVMRIIWILLAVFGGCGLLLYLIFALVMPNE